MKAKNVYPVVAIQNKECQPELWLVSTLPESHPGVPQPEENTKVIYESYLSQLGAGTSMIIFMIMRAHKHHIWY